MVTLAQLKEQARVRSDMEDSEFVSDTALVAMLNASKAELFDLLIGAYDADYFLTELNITATSAVAYALPADFYKLRGIDASTGTNGEWSTVKKFNFNRRNDANSPAYQLAGVPGLEYRIMGSNVRFNKVPDSGTTIKLWYIAKSETLVADDDEFDDVNGFEEYIVVDTAIKMLNKEESDVSVLMAQKQALLKRIEAMAQNRDANEPESISDIYSESVDLTLSRS